MKTKEVYDLVKQIPYGKISTYKELGKSLNSKAYQAIGQILKNNKNPELIPCYKIIKSNGEIGGYSGSNLENIKKKIQKLEKEGIKIKNNKIINFKKVLFKF